jgi:16S rRNA processing protein RimM
MPADAAGGGQMLLTVGRVLRAHGVRGEVVVEVRTDEPEDRYAEGAVMVTETPSGQRGELTVVDSRPHQGRLLVTFAGVADRAAAEALRGLLLQVDSARVAAPSDPDEFHDHQLVGLSVVTLDGERIGEVARIEHAPAADLLVVARDGGRVALVPFVTAMVPEVDLSAARIVVDPPPGLWDL